MKQEIRVPGGILMTVDPRIKLILRGQKEIRKSPQHPVRQDQKETAKV